MNLDQIATKCFILALFIRDDGERLLLGDGFYDFKSNLQHFQGNTIANDIVEIQGDSGQLLAGQVMRSGAQKFEGYIGDATTNRQTIEQKRSDFMAFFRIKHFYKVIYIFPDGSAIQRQRGYLTDAPTIPEIFQKFPEYSVALNFEDANYYEYAEDEYGDEIYAHIIELALSGNATGGLVWDAIGAVTNGISWSGIQTAQGEYISITNALDIPAKLASVEMLGNATQDGTPTPDAPVAVNTATGEQTVEVVGKNLLSADDGTYSSRGITGVVSNGELTLNGTSTTVSSYNFGAFRLIPAGTYTLSANNPSSETGTSLLRLVDIDGNAPTLRACSLNSANATKTFTLTEDTWLAYQWRFDSGKTLTNFTIKPQLELGSTATAYEPYQGQEFEVNLGKNLLPMINGTATIRGITATIADGILTLNGTSTGSGIFKLTNGVEGAESLAPSASWLAEKLPITNLKGTNIAIDYQSGTSPQASSAFRIYSSTSTYINQWYPLTSDQATTWASDTQAPSCLCFFFGNGITFNNYKITLQIERGTSATSFAPYFTPIELAKIGNYQDRIYKTDGKWYIEKNVGKSTYDSTESGWSAGAGNRMFFRNDNSYAMAGSNDDIGAVMSNYFTADTYTHIYSGDADYGIALGGTARRLAIRNKDCADLASFKTWLSTHPTTVYYALATPTTTEITNEALIAQLDALESASLYLGLNNIGTETLNAVPTLKIEYYTEVDLDGAGYEWEPGGNTAKTIVTVAGVDSAWPIWTVQGGAQNPTLTNITTGQTITWQGFVPEGQTLTINMAEMTADLAGANVFEYITGEWIRLAPGNNTLVYTAGSADKPSTLSWNGVLA